MLDSLKDILDVQELDIKMIRLMRLKRERQKELDNIHNLRTDLQTQLEAKGLEILELKKDVRVSEGKIAEVKEKILKLEGQQNKVKKVEEFNALSQELSRAERERTNAEQVFSDVVEKLTMEEEGMESIKESISSTDESSQVFEQELLESIVRINEEGKELLLQRRELEKLPEQELMGIYDKLLHNKKDRVIVPIENRTCSGCHIVLTAQHENLVRKWERLVYCEHCSRILYWPEGASADGSETVPKRRRRRSTTAV
ncbi:MAG: putative nucleic acid-binding Zn-ribbon protein [Chlamydiales bacterium]|jgi:predicted  nucleic acid-binding Zn-ribbon protein